MHKLRSVTHMVQRGSVLSAVFAALLIIAPANVLAGTTVQSVANSTLGKGLLGYWPFDLLDTYNVTTYDRSGQGNNGTLTSGPVATTSPFSGRAMEFNGTSNSVQTNATIGNFGTSDFTVGFWYKTQGTYEYFIGKRTTCNNASFWNVSLNGSGNLVGEVDQDGLGTNYNSITDPTSSNDNAWHHAVMTRSGAVVSIYRDGTLRNSGAGSGTANISNAAATEIGISTQCTPYHLGAVSIVSIDDARIYNRALSAAEVKQLYAQGSNGAVQKTKTATSNGLVGWWTFDRSDLTDKAYDRSGLGNNGSLINGPNVVTGKIQQGISLVGGGTNSYVNIGSGTGLPLPTATSEFTLAAWVKTSATDAAIFGFRNSTNDQPVIDLELGQNGVNNSGTGKPSLLVRDDNGVGLAYINANNAINDNQWHHVVATRSSSKLIRLYVDGVENATPVSDTLSTSITTDWKRIGSEARNAQILNMTGSIDDARIYNRALSSADVVNLYKQTLGIARANTSQNGNLATGLVGLWSFDGKDMTGTTAIDRSGQGNNAKLYNGAAQTIGKIGAALSLDGISQYGLISQNIGALDNASQFSISVWFKRTGIGGSSGTSLFGKGSWGTWGYDVNLMIDNSNNFFAQVDNGADGAASFDYSSDYTLGKWAHAVLVYDGTQTGNENRLKIYFNGVQKTLSFGAYTVPATTANMSGYNQFIGQYAADYAAWLMKGSIDDLRIYNRALSAAESKMLYNMGR